MEKNDAKKVMNLIIVDESGSMSIIHDEALAGINETITTCQSLQEKYPEIEQRVMLASFDSSHYKVHYDNLNVKEVAPLTKKDYCPSGGTPLYDAIGKSVARVHAITAPEDSVLVTIITDGAENCSKEYNLAMVKNLIEKQKAQGWTFTLIGTDNLDVEGMGKTMAIENCLSFCQDEAGTRQMFKKEQQSRRRFSMFLQQGDVSSMMSKYFISDED